MHAAQAGHCRFSPDARTPAGTRPHHPRRGGAPPRGRCRIIGLCKPTPELAPATSVYSDPGCRGLVEDADEMACLATDDVGYLMAAARAVRGKDSIWLCRAEF